MGFVNKSRSDHPSPDQTGHYLDRAVSFMKKDKLEKEIESDPERRKQQLLNGGLGKHRDPNGHEELERIEETLGKVGLTLDDVGRNSYEDGDAIIALSSLGNDQDYANESEETFYDAYSSVEEYEKDRDVYISVANVGAAYGILAHNPPTPGEEWKHNSIMKDLNSANVATRDNIPSPKDTQIYLDRAVDYAQQQRDIRERATKRRERIDSQKKAFSGLGTRKQKEYITDYVSSFGEGDLSSGLEELSLALDRSTERNPAMFGTRSRLHVPIVDANGNEIEKIDPYSSSKDRYSFYFNGKRFGAVKRGKEWSLL